MAALSRESRNSCFLALSCSYVRGNACCLAVDPAVDLRKAVQTARRTDFHVKRIVLKINETCGKRRKWSSTPSILSGT
jgi:hypothetical protein